MECHVGDRRHDLVPSQAVESKRHCCRTSRPSMAWATALKNSVCELHTSWYPPLLPGLARTRPALVSRFSTCFRNGTSASIRRPNSAVFIHSCDPCPVSSTSTSAASLLVRFISSLSTLLDTLINISSFTRDLRNKKSRRKNRRDARCAMSLHLLQRNAYQAAAST